MPYTTCDFHEDVFRHCTFTIIIVHMKKLYSVDLVNSYFSKEEATELILGLINYKIELHSNKVFSTQVKYGIEDEDSKYRLDRLSISRDQVKEFLLQSEDAHFKITAELKIEPKTIR